MKEYRFSPQEALVNMEMYARIAGLIYPTKERWDHIEGAFLSHHNLKSRATPYTHLDFVIIHNNDTAGKLNRHNPLHGQASKDFTEPIAGLQIKPPADS